MRGRLAGVSPLPAYDAYPSVPPASLRRMTSPDRSSPPQWNAVVLGGGDPGDPFAAAHGASVKPLIPIAGQPMALYVLRALRDSERIKEVAYVGPTVPELEPLIDRHVADRGQLLTNLEAGISALGEPQGRVLVVTADIPLLTATDICSLLDSAPEGGLVYPVVRREDCEKAFPGVQRTYARLKDGRYTGGNVFLLEPALLARFLPQLREILAARKNPLKLAALIGPGILLPFILGRLTVPMLERKISDLLGVTARALVTPLASVGTDVDKESDLQLVCARLTGR